MQPGDGKGRKKRWVHDVGVEKDGGEGRGQRALKRGMKRSFLDHDVTSIRQGERWGMFGRGRQRPKEGGKWVIWGG